MKNKQIDKLAELLEKISHARLGADWMTRLELSNLERAVKDKIKWYNNTYG